MVWMRGQRGLGVHVKREKKNLIVFLKGKKPQQPPLEPARSIP